MSTFRHTRKNRYRHLSTFRHTRTKTGTGTCLRFVIPEQKQVQAHVYVSSYHNKNRYRHPSTFRHTTTQPGTCICLRSVIPEQNRYRPVSTFRHTRTQHKTVKYKQLTVPFVTRKNPIFITTAYTRNAVFWVMTTCSLVGTYQSPLENICSHVQVWY